jgi:integrase/recombinase XerC
MGGQRPEPPAGGPRAPGGAEVADFLKHIADERQLSPNTVKAYAKDLEDLATFLDQYLGRAEWRWGDADVDRLALRGFLGWCGRRGLSKRTAARKLAAARTFFRFLHREGRTEANPGRAVRAPKLEKRLPATSPSRTCVTSSASPSTRPPGTRWPARACS